MKYMSRHVWLAGRRGEGKAERATAERERYKRVGWIGYRFPGYDFMLNWGKDVIILAARNK